MERIMGDAFITTPILKSQQTSQVQKKLSINIRQKIMTILKSFTQKQLLFQAVNNIGIPKNFINTDYIESRPDQELNKIYNTICALKKQVLRIKRYSDTPQLANIFTLQSMKIVEQKSNLKDKEKIKIRNFKYLKKQISEENKIKKAIEKQLQYRQKLQKRQKKLQQSQKLKADFNQKRKQVAKSVNKKATQVYQRQKQIQQKWFQKILSNQAQPIQSSSIKRNFNTANSTRRQQNYEMVKQRLQKSRFQLQTHINEQNIERVIKQNSLKQFKHRRLNSMNEKLMQKRLKSQQIRQRKCNLSQEQQKQIIKKMIKKQMKILQTRKHKNNKDSGILNGQNSQIQSTTMMTSVNLYRNSDLSGVNYDKDDQKQNMILQKIARKNEIRQTILNNKVQRMRQKHQIQQYRRQAYKKSQIKLLTQESSGYNDSFIYNKQNNIIKRSQYPIINEIEKQLVVDHQQQNIRKKHQNIIKNNSCDQNIMRLRKLPKSILQKKLKDLKNKQLHQILAQNILNLLH